MATQTWDKTKEETQLGKQTLKKPLFKSLNNNNKLLSTSSWIVDGQQACIKNANESITTIEIFDMQVKKINSHGQLNGNCFQLPNLSTGIYIIRWKNKQGWQSEKVNL